MRIEQGIEPNSSQGQTSENSLTERRAPGKFSPNGQKWIGDVETDMVGVSSDLVADIIKRFREHPDPEFQKEAEERIELARQAGEFVSFARRRFYISKLGEKEGKRRLSQELEGVAISILLSRQERAVWKSFLDQWSERISNDSMPSKDPTEAGESG